MALLSTIGVYDAHCIERKGAFWLSYVHQKSFYCLMRTSSIRLRTRGIWSSLTAVSSTSSSQFN